MKIFTRPALLTFLLCSFLALDVPESAAITKLRGIQVATDVDAQDIAVLEEWNVNIVRYQLIWGAPADTATLSEYNIWLDQALDNLEGLMPAFAAAQIKVVVVLQSPPGGLASLSPKMYRMFKEQWASDAFLSTWETIVTRLKDYPAIYGYDLINEPAAVKKHIPAGIKDLNQIFLEVAQRIRVIDADPNHYLILEPIYGDQAQLRYLDLLPASIPGVLYSAHFYYPLKFQHQTPANPQQYPKGAFNKKKLEKNLLGVVKFVKRLKAAGMPRAFLIGEFSAPRIAPNESSYRYLRDAISIFQKNGWDWIYHAFREGLEWSLEHDSNSNNLTPVTSPTKRLKYMRKQFDKNA
jgi:endoglucanase